MEEEMKAPRVPCPCVSEVCLCCYFQETGDLTCFISYFLLWLHWHVCLFKITLRPWGHLLMLLVLCLRQTKWLKIVECLNMSRMWVESVGCVKCLCSGKWLFGSGILRQGLFVSAPLLHCTRSCRSGFVTCGRVNSQVLQAQTYTHAHRWRLRTRVHHLRVPFSDTSWQQDTNASSFPRLPSHIPPIVCHFLMYSQI